MSSNPSLLPFVDNIAQMVTLGVASNQYTVLQVLGYRTPNDGGGGIFRWSPASTTTANMGTVFQATGISTGRWIRQLDGAVVSVEMFGAYNDGTNSATTLAAFQAVNNYVAASANASQTIFVLGAHYDFGSVSAGVVKAASFNAPMWIGNGMSGADVGTLITYTPPSEAAAFAFIGASGSVCRGGIKNIVFQGNNNMIAVESQGLGGLDVDITIFANAKLAVLLHNKTAGQFTEFNKLTINSNGSALGTMLEYRVTSGDASFHGSGIVNGVMNFGAGGAPAILVGASAFPYAAPLNGSFFPAGSSGGPAIFVQNNSNTGFGEPWFIGDVEIEQSGATFTRLGVGSDFILIGSYSFLGNGYSLITGNMYLANSFATTNTGLGIVAFKPIQKSSDVHGATSITWPANCQNQSWQLVINVIGAGYNANKTVNLVLNSGNGNFTQTGAIDTIFDNSAGYGNISITAANSSGFTFNGASLTYPASGLIFAFTLNQIDQSPSFHGN